MVRQNLEFGVSFKGGRLMLKKIGLVIILMLFSLNLFSCGKKEELFKFNYIKEEDAYEVTVSSNPKITDDIKTLEIPSTYNGKKVLKVYGFSGGFANLSSIIIPVGIEDVVGFKKRDYLNQDDYVFISLPSSLKYIDDDSFHNIGFVEVTISSNLFLNGGHCSWDKIRFLKGTKIIPERFAADNYILKEIYMESIEVIEDSAFERCSYNLKKIVLSNNLKQIGNNAFANCFEIEEIVIPGSLKTISNYCFNHNTSLKQITIEEGVETIGVEAFSNTNPVSIELPTTMEYLYESAFSFCKSLKNIKLNNGLLYIGKEAFKNCDSLEEIIIPGSVRIIEENPFLKCDNLKKIYIEAASLPSEWKWNPSDLNCEIVWGYKEVVE